MPAPFDFRDPDNLHTLGHIQGGAQRRKLAEQSEETNRLLKEQNQIEREKRCAEKEAREEKRGEREYRDVLHKFNQELEDIQDRLIGSDKYYEAYKEFNEFNEDYHQYDGNLWIFDILDSSNYDSREWKESCKETIRLREKIKGILDNPPTLEAKSQIECARFEIGKNDAKLARQRELEKLSEDLLPKIKELNSKFVHEGITFFKSGVAEFSGLVKWLCKQGFTELPKKMLGGGGIKVEVAHGCHWNKYVKVIRPGEQAQPPHSDLPPIINSDGSLVNVSGTYKCSTAQEMWEKGKLQPSDFGLHEGMTGEAQPLGMVLRREAPEPENDVGLTFYCSCEKCGEPINEISILQYYDEVKLVRDEYGLLDCGLSTCGECSSPLICAPDLNYLADCLLQYMGEFSGYYVRQEDDEVLGPFSADEIKGFIAENRINADTKIKKTGGKWYCASTYSELGPMEQDSGCGALVFYLVIGLVVFIFTGLLFKECKNTNTGNTGNGNGGSWDTINTN